MNRFSKKSWIICLILALSACGYRTSPLPYKTPDKSLPGVTGTSLTLQGNNRVFRWQVPDRIQWAGAQQQETAGYIPEKPEDGNRDMTERGNTRGKVEKAPEKQPDQQAGDEERDTAADVLSIKTDLVHRFRISIYRGNTACPACETNSEGSLEIELPGGAIRFLPATGQTVFLPQARFHAESGNRFSLVIPTDFFTARGLADNCYFTIDYFLDSGLLSPPSVQIDTHTLKPVPKPKLTLHKRVSNVGRDGTQPEYFLLLEWKPQQETIRHTMQQDGGISENVVHYGLNLYRSCRDIASTDTAAWNFRKVEVRINSTPLLYGRFSLLNFEGRLTARQVDRFGNESESVTVFDGEY